MNDKKKLGIWMDHSSAHITEFNDGTSETTTIESAFTNQVKGESQTKGEHLMHNKEQHQQSDYYKKLGATIRNYDEVLLFGPTEAKNELFNLLSADHNFDKIKLDILPTDKMNEHEQHSFIVAYFSKQ